jgi:hypothetical protein
LLIVVFFCSSNSSAFSAASLATTSSLPFSICRALLFLPISKTPHKKMRALVDGLPRKFF